MVGLSQTLISKKMKKHNYNVVKLSVILIASLVFGCQKNDGAFDNVSPVGFNNSESESSKNYPSGTALLHGYVGTLLTALGMPNFVSRFRQLALTRASAC